MYKFCKHFGRRGRGNCHREGQNGKAIKDFPCGTQVRIQDIRCCPRDRCRLLSMGLTPGTTAEISSNGCGSCCLRVRDADIIIGDDIASTVTACLVQDSCLQS